MALPIFNFFLIWGKELDITGNCHVRIHTLGFKGVFLGSLPSYLLWIKWDEIINTL